MTYCKDCRPEKKRASYGRQGGKPTHCSKHGKSHGFVNVASQRCDHDGCEERPVYGVKGGKRTHCRKHKSDEMIDVVGQRCKHDECGEFAHYGVKGGKRTHCRTHKLATMIDAVNKRCEDDECDKRAVYGVKGGKRTHCRKHKSDEMIDVVSKRCDHDECDEFAVYGVQRYRPTHCREHKLLEMINVVGQRCKHDGCLARPSFGFVRGKATHCCDHQLPRMVDVANQRCTECKTTVTHQKDKLCASCRQYLKMGASRKLIRIERRIIEMLLLHGTIPNDHRTKLNKSIGATCGGYRPDIYIDFGSFVMIIEIDEHQHRPRYISRVVDGVVTSTVVGPYTPECETVRMLTIVQAEQMPVYFIRYNPDKCTIDGKVIKVSPEKRCEALRILINSVIKNGTPDALMTITFMYYDGALLRTETPALPAGF